MKKAVIIYPHGGGGSWLHNLIYHLESNDYTLPTVDLVFDKEKKSNSIDFFHGLEWYEPNVPTLLDMSKWKRKILFSCTHSFNLYINDSHKIRYNKNIYDYQSLSMIDQYHNLTDNARHFVSNNDFKKFYCTNINLDYSLIFQQPKLFIHNLFDLLDNLQLDYSHNVEYCLSSIANYRSTCLRPNDHYGNRQSLLWLAWCHALCLIDNIHISELLDQSKSMNDLAEIFLPYQDRFLSLSEQCMFDWHD